MANPVVWHCLFSKINLVVLETSALVSWLKLKKCCAVLSWSPAVSGVNV